MFSEQLDKHTSLFNLVNSGFRGHDFEADSGVGVSCVNPTPDCHARIFPICSKVYAQVDGIHFSQAGVELFIRCSSVVGIPVLTF